MSRHQNNSSLGFLFGGADTRPKVSANTFATGSNQNCGNFITDRSTVRFSRKLSTTQKPTTCIHRQEYTHHLEEDLKSLSLEDMRRLGRRV